MYQNHYKERHIKGNLFAGLKVYYSGSIKGASEIDPAFAWHLVSYMIEEGAEVLSEHVAARNPEEMRAILARRTGKSIQELWENPEPWFAVRTNDINWIDEATHFVALVNAPSHGVGMEIERALLKPQRGLPLTPILCLVHEHVLERMSWMIRGISAQECPVFFLKTYKNFDEAQSIVRTFLIT